MNFVARIRRSYAETILDKVDLKLLRFFTAVAEAGSFTRAAERLLVNQSHLSRQVMRLERALGHRLLVRRPRHVELTDAGQILLQEANFITIKLDGLQERIHQAVRGSRGSLVLGFTVADSFNPLSAKIVDALARHEPRVAMNFCFEPRESLIEAMADRRIHACFARPPAIARPDFRIDPLISEPILLAVPKHHRLAEKTKTSLSQVAHEPFVLWERDSDPEIYDDIIEACQRAGFSPRVIHHAPNPVCALLLVSAGLGVSLIPASLNSIHATRVRFVLLAGEGPNTGLALITRANEHIASVKVLRKHALAVSRSLVRNSVPTIISGR
jgi:DNA-binding transcriptional LysR family regulator